VCSLPRTHETEQVYKQCIERLAWRFVGSEPTYDNNATSGVLFRYFVIGFLYRAVKHSHEQNGGRGAKIILTLFQELLKDLRHRCLSFDLPLRKKRMVLVRRKRKRRKLVKKNWLCLRRVKRCSLKYLRKNCYHSL